MKMKLLCFVLGAVVCAWLPRTISADATKNPTGPTGEFSGSITTGGSIDPYTGNAKRFITDLSVTGAVGVYPLKWARVLNTRGGRMGPLGGGGQWAHSYQWGLWLDRNPPADWDDPEGGEYSGPAGQITYPDGRTVALQSGDFVNYEPLQPFDGVDRVVPAGGDDYTLLLRDGGRVEFKHYAGAPSRGSLRPTEIVDPHGLKTHLTYDTLHRLIQVTEPAGRYLQINWIDKSYWRYISNEWRLVVIYLIDNVQAFAAPGNLVETVRYTYEEETISDAWGWLRTYNLTHAYYDGGTHAEYDYFPSTMTSGHAVSAHIKSCDDVRFDGPMKQIAYEYLTGFGVPQGVVTKEKNLRTGQTVAEVIYPEKCFSPPNGDPSYQRRTERRPDGATRTFQYADIANNGTLELQSYSDFQNHSSSIAYGGAPNGNWTKILTDARGNATTVEKEPIADQPMRIYNPDSTSKGFAYYYVNGAPYYLAIQGDELGRNTYYTRAAADYWRVTKIWYGFDSNNHSAYPTEEFSYNQFGQVQTHKLSTGGTEYFYYDEGLPQRGLKTRHVDAMGNTTRYQYYSSGPNTDRLWKVTDPRNNTTTYEYNLRGQVTKVIHPDDSYTQSFYNPDGTLAWSADENHRGAVNDPNQRTRYVYDDYKRVMSVTNPMGETTTNIYAPWNGAGSLSHTTSTVYQTHSPMGKQVHHDYDANLRRTITRTGVAADDAWTFFEYDEVGNLTKTTDPRTKETVLGYDNRNRQIWMNNPIATDRNSNGHTMDWVYDGVGNKIKETRADNAFRSWEYELTNPMNRLTKTIDWRMSAAEPEVATNYERNVTSTEEKIIDAKNATYTFYFDALHRKIQETYPSDATGAQRTETWQYDPAGNMILHKTPANGYRHTNYDNRNRPWDSWSWDTNAAPSLNTRFDAAGRMTSVVTRHPLTNSVETTVTFGYDDANRQISEDQTLAGYPTRRVETPRDADGNRHQLHVPYYYSIYYDYTQRNQLKTIYGGNMAPVFQYTYDASGNMLKRQAPWIGVNDSVNVVSWDGVNQYDALNRPCMWENTGAGGVPFTRSWHQYDKVGRMTAIVRDEDAGKGDRFSYNPVNQLTSAVYDADNVWSGNPQNPGRTVGYTYTPDTLNRQSVNDNGAVTSYSASAINQYQSFNGVTYNYDFNFNLREAPNFWGVFDPQNRLAEAGGGGNVVDFSYDGLGRCVRRVVYPPGGGSSAVIYVYDGWNPIMEFDGAGNYMAWTIYGTKADEILGRWRWGVGQMSYHTDVHGNVIAVLDGSGNIAEKYNYDAFGKPKIMDRDGNERPQSWIGNRFMFQGREWIAELGIYDYRNRMYLPELGRFLQVDPIGFDAGDMNLFRYCGDDPVNLTDPMGLTPFSRDEFRTNLTSWGHNNWATVFQADLLNRSRDLGFTMAFSTKAQTPQPTAHGESLKHMRQMIKASEDSTAKIVKEAMGRSTEKFTKGKRWQLKKWSANMSKLKKAINSSTSSTSTHGQARIRTHLAIMTNVF